ncbi:MAG: tetratricopeptide repeat protein [Imperialibacter sp.]|uniref:tetratricopeptide repeat protein n=1 Tax=Imperialibacter sp. TaxID=2038411 RepID=UPI0032ED67FB
MKKLTIFTITIWLTGSIALAQNSRDTYQAYLSSLTTLWETSVSRQQTAYNQSKSPQDLFMLALTQYGLLNNTMADSDETLFDKYIDAADKNLDKLIELNYKSAEAKAIQSAVTGLKIAYSSWKGMFLGAKSANLIDEAMDEAPGSPVVRKLHASYLYFTPEMFGGDKALATSEFTKAVELFEKGDVSNNWLYLDALAWLGIALNNQGEKQQAREVYQKALAIAPDFNWVKFELLPNAK